MPGSCPPSLPHIYYMFEYHLMLFYGYPLVNVYKKTMENHHVQWVNPLFLWAIFNSYVKLTEGNWLVVYLPL